MTVASGLIDRIVRALSRQSWSLRDEYGRDRGRVAGNVVDGWSYSLCPGQESTRYTSPHEAKKAALRAVLAS